MRMKKWLSALLAVVLVVTAIPVSNLLVSAEETTTEPTTILAGDTEYVTLNKYSVQTGQKIGIISGGRGDLNWDDPTLYDIRTKKETNGFATLADNSTTDYRWPYAAIKVTAVETGEYDLSLNVQGNSASAYDTFGMLVDGVMHVLNWNTDGSKNTVSTSVSLTAGTHIILFTTPMPEKAEEAGVESDSASYAWFDFYDFIVDADLIVEKLPSKTEVAESVDTRIEAEDTSKVTYNGYTDTADTSNTYASNGALIGGVTKGNLTQSASDIETYLDRTTTAYVQYTVDAPKDGLYNLRVGSYIGAGSSVDTSSVAIPKATLIVNDGQVLQTDYVGAWNSLCTANFVVELKAGRNIIRSASLTTEQDCFSVSCWINQDFLDVDANLEVVSNETQATANGYSDEVLGNNFSQDNTTELGSSYRTNMVNDNVSLDDLEYSASKIDRWAWSAIDVQADKAGYYDISITVKSKMVASNLYLGMLVNGKLYKTIFYNNTSTTEQYTISRTVYLNEGSNHVLVTTPMRENRFAATADWNICAWMNVCSYTLDEGLSFNAKPTLSDIQADLGMRIEAEDTAYVSWNSYSTTESGTGASGTVVGGAGGKKQTYEEIGSSHLNKAGTAYVQYTVNAPADGEYVLRVGYLAGKNGTSDVKPYSAVIVNDNNMYKAQFDEEWGNVDVVEVAVQLKAGRNLIRCTTITSDQECLTDGSNDWINQDFLDIPKELTAVANGSLQTVTGEDERVFSNKYADDDSADADDTILENGSMSGWQSDKTSIETIETDMFTKLDNWAFTALKVSAPENGYYDITVNIAGKNVSNSPQIGMIVDGKASCQSFTMSSGAGTVDATVYLTKGTHIIMFTPRIAKDETETTGNVYNVWPWTNWISYLVDSGLTVEDADASLLTNGIEAENTDYVSHNGDFTSKVWPGASEGKVAGGAISNDQTITLDDLNKGYIDWNGSSYVQFAVNAPADGTYDITLRMMADCIPASENEAKPYAVVLAGGEVHKVQLTAEWKEFEEVTLTVNLVAGNNIINCTAITGEQPDNLKIVYDYLAFDETLTAVKISEVKTPTETTNAGNAENVLYNKYTSDGTNLGSASTTDIRWDKPTISTLTVDNLRRYPYAAIKVTAASDGYYDVKLVSNGANGNAVSKHIALMVDGKTVYPMGFVGSAPTIGATIYLTAGTHTLVFTTPMPVDEYDSSESQGNLWPWFNMSTITVTGLTIESAPSKAEIESPSYMRIEAEDKTKAEWNVYGADSEYVTESVTGASGTVVDGVTQSNLTQTYTDIKDGYLDKKTTAYIQYVVEAPEDGTYKIKVGFQATTDDTSKAKPYVTVLVNEDAYKAQFDESWGNIDVVELEVELVKGYNVIRCLGLTTDQASFAATTSIKQDFLDVEPTLTPVAVATVDATVDTTDSKVISNMYTGDKNVGNGWAGNGSFGNFRTDLPSVETLEKVALQKGIDDWPWIALKVTAIEDGYYDITVNANLNTASTSNHIGMFVDGKTSGHELKVVANTKIDTTVYLTKGTHIILFTAVMPELASKAEDSTTVYPWVDFGTVELGTGLTLGTVTKDEVLASVSKRIEAEDDTKVTYNTYTAETSNSASNGSVVGGVTRGNITQNYEDIEKYIDKVPTPYVQYAVNTPEAGDYYIRLVSYIGESADNQDEYDLPFVAVLANGVSYKAQYTGSWNAFNEVILKVTLKEGLNYIRVTSMTADQKCKQDISCWINHDYIDVSGALDIVAVADLPSSTDVNAGDETKVLAVRYTDNGDTLGGAKSDGFKNDRTSIETIMESDFTEATYAAFKVNAKEDGYYDIHATVQTTGSSTSKYVAIIVDGKILYTTTIAIKGSQQVIGISIPLEAGEHTIMITSPMPLTKAEAEALEVGTNEDGSEDWTAMNNAWPWFDMVKFTLSGGLEVLDAPTEDEVYASGDTAASGDVNYDGAIDEEDPETLRKELVGIDVVINLDAANAHEDDVIDVRDLVAVKKIVKTVETAPVAYLSDYNEDVAIQDLSYITTYSASDLDSTTGTVITIDSSKTYREIDGFGASMTDTSAYVLSQMNAEDTDAALVKLFSKEDGIGINMLRNPIGASDFVPDQYGYYTYEDTQGQFALAGGETENILKYTKRAMELNNVNLILSPWTAPLWMKSEAQDTASDDTPQGVKDMWRWTSASQAYLLEEHYQDYADYLVKTIQAYEAQGIPVDMITPQNEPFTINNWTGMYWDNSITTLALGGSLIDFTNNYLRPSLDKAELETKILNLDYNYNAWEKGSLILNATKDATQGIAFHWYGTDGPEVMENVDTTANADELIYVTEASSSYSGDSEDMSMNAMVNKTSGIVRALRSGAQAFLSWNIAVSSEGGPTVNDINEGCIGLLKCDLETKEISLTKDYYSLAHFSKFIEIGAVRVDSTDTGAATDYELVNVVTKNPDGSMTAVIVNSNKNTSEVCKLVDGDKVMEITLAPKSTVTITWTP